MNKADLYLSVTFQKSRSGQFNIDVMIHGVGDPGPFHFVVLSCRTSIVKVMSLLKVAQRSPRHCVFVPESSMAEVKEVVPLSLRTLCGNHTYIPPSRHHSSIRSYHKGLKTLGGHMLRKKHPDVLFLQMKGQMDLGCLWYKGLGLFHFSPQLCG